MFPPAMRDEAARLLDAFRAKGKRIATAEKFVRDFSIGTECGFGRREPSTVPELLRIHAQAAA